MKRILAIDDDEELCSLLSAYFEREGFGFVSAFDGETGLREALSGQYDLVLLDVMIPEKDGFEVLRGIRSRMDLPVLMLTARGDPVDRIVGLELGADDYISKPFLTRELAARVRAVLRRTERRSEEGGNEADEEGRVVVGDMELHSLSRTVRIGRRPVDLTGTEFRLLNVLMGSAGQLVSLERLSREVLGRRHSPFDRSLGVHVSNLRRKLGPYPEGGERIRTVRGEGYVCVFPDRSRGEEESEKALAVPSSDLRPAGSSPTDSGNLVLSSAEQAGGVSPESGPEATRVGEEAES
jgi:two-component system response regulator CpxR